MFDLSSVLYVLSQATPDPNMQPSMGGLFGRLVPMMAMVFFVFYFLVISPQNKKLMAQTKLIADLKKGDQVLTSGGILGRVASVEQDYVSLEVSPNVRIRFEKSKIVKRVEKEEAKAAA